MSPPTARSGPVGGRSEDKQPAGDSSAVTIPPGADVGTDSAVQTTLTEVEARSLTGQIRSLGEAIADRVDLLVDKVRQAREGEAHAALGYKSWPDYVQTEFAGVLPRLDRQSRRELVSALTETGMSSRAIAPVVGVSKSQVAEDVSSSGHLVVEATDDQFKQAITEARADGNLSRANVEQKIAAIPTTNNVVGIDGKTYTRTEPAPRRRRPLPDAYRDTSRSLLRSAESLSRLHQDDRFKGNREAVRRDISDLARAANGLLDLLDDLGVDRLEYGTLS